MMVSATVGAGAAAPSHPAKQVLLLNSYHKQLEWTDRVVDGVTRTLNSAGDRIELFIEYMDTKRFPAETHFPVFQAYLQRKYSNRPFDVVIASDNHAFEFVKKHRTTLFDGLPVVFCGVNYFAPHMLDGFENATGIVESIDIQLTLETALHLQPNVNRVVIINDRTATGNANRQLVADIMPEFVSQGVRFEFYDDMTMADIRRDVAILGPDTLILLLSFTRDKDGNVYSYADSLAAISEVCPVPIYGVWEFYLKKGIVGGMLTSGFLQGKNAAQLALRILSGTPTQQIDVIEKSPNRFIFDAKQLQKFNIDRAALPDNSLIVNDPQHLFVRYQKWIWVGLILLVVQMVVIITFWSNIQMRRKAEEKLRQHNLLLKALHDTAMGLIGRLALDDLIEDIVTRAADFAKTSHGYFYLYDKSLDALVLKVGMGLYQNHIGYVVQRKMGVAGQVLETGEVLVINNYPNWPGRHPDALWDPVQSIAGIPLKSATQFIGVIGLLHTEKGKQISDDDIDMLRRFGELATLALNNARLYSQLENELTERKQAQKALINSEEKFRKLFYTSPIWMELVDLEDGRFIEANNSFFEITGYSRQEVIGQCAEDIGLWPEPQLRKNIIDIMKQHQGLDAHPCRFRMKNGDILDFLWSAQIIEFNGKQCALSGLLDITDRKRFENALKESENRLRMFVQNTPAPVAMCNHDMQYMAYSRRWVTDYGLPDENLIGRSHYDLFPEIPDHWKAEHQRCLSGEVIKSKAEKLKRADGSFDWVRREIHPWHNDSGTIGGIIIFTEVITKQMQAEKEKLQLEARLHQSQRLEAIGTLSGGIAHDFNNILTPIMIQADMGLLKLPQGNPVRNNLEKIRQAGDRAKNLVKQILSFSRPSKQEKRPLEVKLVIKEALKLIRASLPSNIDIQQHIDTTHSSILGDPTQIHQVVMNLCANAGYAMRGQNGLLDIRLTDTVVDAEQADNLGHIKPGPYLELRVKDTGTGIQPDDIERIFEPYFTTKGISEGTGLGLAVVHGIVTAHGGAISVNSSPNQGTTFRVLFPRLTQPDQSHHMESSSVSGGSETILLVDDEPATIEALQEILEEVGYQVVGHTDVLQAYAEFEANPHQFDLVITDQTMPHMTGVALSSKMWHLRPDLPVILCTGYSESVTREAVEKMGIKALVMKPFDTNQITRTIRSVLADTAHEDRVARAFLRN